MNTTAKGSRFRLLVQRFLDSLDYQTEFRPWREAGDDITAVAWDHELSVECKDHKAITLSAFVDQAVGNAKPHQVPLVVVKRRGRASVGEAYFVLRGSDFARLVGRDA